MIPKSPCRLVLDTNVCLDLFVFRDVRWQRLLQSMQSGDIECVTRDDCRTEWTLVLAYDRFGLDAKARDLAIAEFDRWIKPIDTLRSTQVKLPICKDADDQKFIELAVASGAAYLVKR
ncbi:MAG: putative toxin-antitoxin system toxin component, PIN family [Burkholderiaceae bacterium]